MCMFIYLYLTTNTQNNILSTTPVSHKQLLSSLLLIHKREQHKPFYDSHKSRGTPSSLIPFSSPFQNGTPASPCHAIPSRESCKTGGQLGVHCVVTRRDTPYTPTCSDPPFRQPQLISQGTLQPLVFTCLYRAKSGIEA